MSDVLIAQRSDRRPNGRAPTTSDPNPKADDAPPPSRARGPRSLSAVDRHIGERLRERRTAIGMSQDRLAELVGIRSQQVQKYEKGSNRIPASRLSAIAAALQTEVLTFYAGLAPTPSSTDVDPGASPLRALATREGRELADLFLGIESPRLRKSILALVQAVAEVHQPD